MGGLSESRFGCMLWRGTVAMAHSCPRIWISDLICPGFGVCVIQQPTLKNALFMIFRYH